MQLNQKGEVIVTVAAVLCLTIFGFLTFNAAHGWEYRVKATDSLEEWYQGTLYPEAKYQSDGFLDSAYFGQPKVQRWALYLLFSKYGKDVEIRYNKGVYEIYCKTWVPFSQFKWRIISCDAKGEYLYIGCKIDYPGESSEDVKNIKMLGQIQKFFTGSFDSQWM